MEKVNRNLVSLHFFSDGRYILAILILGFLCLDCNPCHDELLRECRSPTGKYEAQVYLRDCGATTSYSTVVCVHQSGWNSAEIFIIHYRNEINPRWIDDSTLLIEYSGKTADVFKAIRNWHDIEIEFKRVDSLDDQSD